MSTEVISISGEICESETALIDRRVFEACDVIWQAILVVLLDFSYEIMFAAKYKKNASYSTLFFVISAASIVITANELRY